MNTMQHHHSVSSTSVVQSCTRELYRTLYDPEVEQHVERVVANAQFLQRRVGGDRDMVIAGAWLHHLHDHPSELSAALDRVPLSGEKRDFLRKIVDVCRPSRIRSEHPLEAKIVFDADALDTIGPLGCVRELYSNCSTYGQSWADAVANCRRVQELFASKLQTSSAIVTAKPLIEASKVFWYTFDAELRRTGRATP